MTIISIDTETYDEHGKPQLNCQLFTLGGIMRETKGKAETHYEEFTSRELMAAKLIAIAQEADKKKEMMYIYAHNMQYDFITIFLNHIKNKKFRYFCLDPFLVQYGEHTWFLDSMNFYKMSLAKVGEIIQLPKLNGPEQIKEANDLSAYLKRDVEIVYKSILHIKKTLEILGFTPRKLLTAGQVAMTCFQTHLRHTGQLWDFMPNGEIPHTRYHNFIRKAYRGGTNIAYKQGNYPICTEVDIRSTYPAIMAEMEVPKLDEETKLDSADINQIGKQNLYQFIGVAKVTIRTPEKNTLPFISIKHAGIEKVPTKCTMTSHWTLEELQYAEILGYKITKWHAAVIYPRTKNKPFQQYMTTLFQEREKSSKAMGEVIKILMNSLYGKFSQQRYNQHFKWITRKDTEKYLKRGWKVQATNTAENIATKKGTKYVPRYSNPMISLMITAKQRIRLHKDMTKIDKEDLLYCDTDSIIFQHKDKYLTQLKIGTGMGDWKVVELKKPCTILGEKRYHIGSQLIMAGITKKNITKQSFQHGKEIEDLKMFTLKNAFDSGNFEKLGTFTPTTYTVKAHTKNQLPTPEVITE